jgi:hypothetical protein
VLLVSMDLYACEELLKVVPLCSLSYVLIA